jgi:uncharacterized membrane protein YphA (DoxX/SURF4 family)
MIVVTLQALLSLVFLATGALKLTPGGGPDAKLFPKIGLALKWLRPLGWLQLMIGTALLIGLWWNALAAPAALAASAYFGWALTRALQAKPAQFGDAAQVTPVLLLCLSLFWLQLH